MNFYNAMHMVRTSTSHQIKQSNANFEDYLIEKELNSHLLNENTDPPKYFSPVPTLLTTCQRSETMKLFPIQGSQFSGKNFRNSRMDNVELLSMIKTAQEYCKLSEKEFKEFLLLFGSCLHIAHGMDKLAGNNSNDFPQSCHAF